MKLMGLNCPVCGEPDVGFVPPCWIVCKCGVLPADQVHLWIVPGGNNTILVYPCRGPSESIEITGPPRTWVKRKLFRSGRMF